MAAKAHAILSASSSDRWLHCPPSARLCETYEDKGSDYAAEGTDAHALGEHKLKTALGLPSEDPTDSLKWYSEEMEDATSGYAEYVLEQVEAAKETCTDPVVLIEQRVDFSRWVEQGFGTADCVIIADGTLRVIDYKHGLSTSFCTNSATCRMTGASASPMEVTRTSMELFSFSREPPKPLIMASAISSVVPAQVRSDSFSLPTSPGAVLISASHGAIWFFPKMADAAAICSDSDSLLKAS